MAIKNNFVLLFVVFLLSLSFAYASDFSATQDPTLNVCSCELLSNPIILQNIGQIKDVFYITQEGSASQWSNIFPQMVVLEPGQSKQLHNFIKAPCGVYGDYELKTRIISSSTIDVLTQKVSIKRCSNIEIVFESLTKEGCNCTSFVYQFWVTNTGTFEDNYRLAISKFADFTTASLNPILLEQGDSQEVLLYITPSCDLLGNFTTTFRVTSEKGQFYAETPLKLNIKECVVPEVNITTNVTAPPVRVPRLKTLFALTIGTLFLFVVMLVVYFAISREESAYYKAVKLRKPKIKKPKIRDFNELIKDVVTSRAFKILVALVIILIAALLIYKGLQQIKPLIPVNETNLTLNITTPINETIVPEENLTEEVNVTQPPKLKPSLTLLYYFAMGFAILFLILLIRVRSLQKPVKRKKKKRKIRFSKRLYRTIKPRVRLITLLILIVIIVLLIYYLRERLCPLLTSFKELLLLYIGYVVLGFVILATLIFVLNKLKKD